MGAKRKGLYDVHPSVAYAQAVLDNLPERTGRSLAQWTKLVVAEGPAGTARRLDWLKRVHALGGTTASLIVAAAEGRGAEDTDPAAYLRAAPRYVEAMYAGGKAGLRPLHDALVALGRGLGKEVRLCPCETILPFYRNHVFAQIKPSTRTRIDFGLALKGAPGKLPSRLLPTGGLAKGDRITHRIAVSSPDDLDAGLRHWLRVAFDLDA